MLFNILDKYIFVIKMIKSEDYLELNPKFRKKLELRTNEERAGKFVSFSEVRKKYSKE
jgi:hypothetical protein